MQLYCCDIGALSGSQWHGGPVASSGLPVLLAYARAGRPRAVDVTEQRQPGFPAGDRSVPTGHRTDAERGVTRDKAGAVNSLYAFAVAKSALQRGPANRGVLSARG